MILTPLSPDRLRGALRRFRAGLASDYTRRIFARISLPSQTARAWGAHAALQHSAALRLARRLGIALRDGRPRSACGWDGRALASRTEAYVLLHEIAHYQLAAPARRRAADFGLGPGPESGDRARAARAATRDGIAREREEAMASLLGILWEVELGQPALASFLDQNWLEGHERPTGPRHFETVVAELAAGGFLGRAGRPTRKLRHAGD